MIGDHLLQFGELKCGRLINNVFEVLKSRMDSHVYATPLYGIEIEGLTRWDVDNFFLSRPDRSLLDVCSEDAQNVENIEMAWNRMQGGVWLCGTTVGTPDFAEQEFFSGSKRLISALAIAFCLVHDKGAASTRIGIKTDQSRNWFGYGKEKKALRVSWQTAGGAPLGCTQAYIVELRDQTDWFVPLVRTLLKEEPTELESAMQRAAHWFHDAQSDPDIDMRFLKFWSCIECFFSVKQGETTRDIKDGLSAVLIHGGVRLATPEEWRGLRKEIDRLYDLRSKAVHDAKHGHIGFSDVATVSTWAAAVIVSMGALDHQGYTTREQLKEQIIKLTDIHQRANYQGGGEK
ncbi:Apea-like HEPN [compost metagenome]